MNQLVKLELKKILTRKANRIAMVLGLLLVVIFNVALIHGSSVYLGEGKEITGLEAIRMKEEAERELTPVLTEDFLTDFLRAYQAQANGVDYSLLGLHPGLYNVILENNTSFLKDYDNYEELQTIDTEHGIDFYGQRLRKIENRLNSDYTAGNYSEAEKTYWMNKAQAVKTPFAWGSTEGWNIVWNGIKVLTYLFLVVSICLMPVFAGEYQNRTDALLLSSKYGHGKLIGAKILAALLFTVGYVGGCSLLSVGTNLAILGVDGWNLPIQLWETTIPYNLNILQVCSLNLLVLFVLFLMLTAFSLMLSAVCKNQVAALALALLLFFGTMFVPFSKSSSVINDILYLLPTHAANVTGVLGAFQSYQFGSVIIPYCTMIFLVYGVLIVLCFLLAARSFHRHQIGA